MSDIGDIRVDTIMPEIYDDWPLIPFEDCLKPAASSYAKLKQKDMAQAGAIPVVDQGEEFVSGYTDNPDHKYPGTLPVIVFGDHTRRFKFIDFEFAVGADGTKLLHPIEDLEPRFFFHYLRTLNLESHGYSRHYRFLKEAFVPVPPLAEQRRIVGKLELLLGKVSSSQQRLSRVPGLLKRFRQSVLAAACSGKLTADWREENPDTGSADSLREQIDELRRSAWKEQRASKGQSSREADYPIPALASDEFDFDHPEGWLRSSMDELTSIITSGSRDWKQYYRTDGLGTFIMAQNVRPLLFDRSYRLAVAPPEDDRDRIRSEVREGDLLITIVGANTGDVCRIPEPLDQHYVCQSVALMRPVVLETAKFLELCLNSGGHGLAQYRKWIYGEGRPHLSFDHLRETAILLPPLAEQQEIVRRVEKLFAFADQIEARLKLAQSHVDRITQSLLAKAFRGELVPTEHALASAEGRDYETASELLDRINAKRITNEVSVKPKRKQKAAKQG